MIPTVLFKSSSDIIIPRVIFRVVFAMVSVVLSTVDETEQPRLISRHIAKKETAHINRIWVEMDFLLRGVIVAVPTLI